MVSTAAQTAIGSCLSEVIFPCLIVAQQKQLPLERLDGPTRAKVLAALAALIILGFAILALVWLGARVARRYMKAADLDGNAARRELPLDDWTGKPLE